MSVSTRKKLCGNELNDFEDLLKAYLESNDEADLEEIKWELNNQSKFTAFKRTMIRENPGYQAFSSYFIN